MNIFIFLFNFIFLVTPQIFTPDKDASIINDTMLHFTEPTFKMDRKIYEHAELAEEFISKILVSTGNSIFFLVEITNTTSVEIIVEYCRALYAQDISNETRLGFIAIFQYFLQGTGPLEPSHLFTGFYPPFNIDSHGHVYNTSVAFLLVLLATFVACFYMMIQYSSIGVQEALTVHSKKSNFYSNEIFSAWEYGIKRPECADHLHHRFVLDIKTALDEDRSAKKVTARSTRMWVKLYVIRISINIFLLMWLILCCYLIYFVTVYQMREMQEHALSEPGFGTFFRQFLPSLTLIVLNSISPIIFNMLATFEKYSARVESNLSIFRNLVLYLSSIIILLNTFYNQVACKAKDICGAGLDATCRSPRCWETYIGQQLYKLTITKIFVLIAVFLCSDVIKYFIYQKWDNKCTQMMGAPAFSLPSEVLGAINSQTILWLGVFYSPLLPAVMIFKVILMFHLKKMKVLKLCPPQESSYRASKINSVFIFVMLISFFVVLVVQSFAIDSISPSRGCGPFRYFNRMTEAVPLLIRRWLSVLMSYWALVFIVFILCIALNYYWRIIVSQKELLKRLKAHLVLQSYDKQFLLKSIAELKDKKQE